MEREKRKKEKEEKLSLFDTPRGESTRLNILKTNNSIDDIYRKNKKRGRFNLFGTDDESEDKKEEDDSQLKKIYVNKKYKLKDNDDMADKDGFYKRERLRTDLGDEEDIDDLLYKNNKKKQTNYDEDEDQDKTGDLYGTDKFNLFKKQKGSKTNKGTEQWDDDNNNLFKKRNLTFRYSDTLMSNLSESLLRGMPTKIKIFKCVVWKSSDPTVNEDTIKHILHRSGSQILERGGFVVKLPKDNIAKLNQSLI